jgi:phage baseplate assembly protein W
MAFLGRGWSFPPRFDSNKHLVMVEDVRDIEESLHILLATHCGERVMLPTYGTTLHRLMFENADESLLTALKDTLAKAILFFEPRVELMRVDAHISAQDWACMELLLDYRIRTTNTRHNMVYPLYFDQASQAVSAR